MISRALLVIAIIVGTALVAHAQPGDTPGLPGGAPTEELREPFPGPSQPHCRLLLSMRDHVQKHGRAITAANEKKASPGAACRLFHVYIAAEVRLLKALDSHGPSCGAPSHIIQQVRDSHTKAREIGSQICQAARLPFRPDPPAMDDMLIPPKPMPRPELWPTRLSEHQ